MARGINLNSQKWLDLIFKDKNKEFGAYVLRRDASDRHLKALLLVALIGLLAVFLPRFIDNVLPKSAAPAIDESFTVTEFIEQQIPEDNQLPEPEYVPPPPELKSTVKLTEIKIVEDDKVTDDDLMKSQDELTQTDLDISIANVEGLDEGGIDIADIQDHKVVVQTEVVEEKVFSHVEIMPSFPGGQDELRKWLGENLRYPAIAEQNGVQGRVVISFIVLEDGTISDAKVARSLDPSCDREALAVVKKMPKWNAGVQNGRAVKVLYNLPVTFRLENS